MRTRRPSAARDLLDHEPSPFAVMTGAVTVFFRHGTAGHPHRSRPAHRAAPAAVHLGPRWRQRDRGPDTGVPPRRGTERITVGHPARQAHQGNRGAATCLRAPRRCVLRRCAARSLRPTAAGDTVRRAPRPNRVSAVLGRSAHRLRLRAVLVDGCEEGPAGGLHHVRGRRCDRYPAASSRPASLRRARLRRRPRFQGRPSMRGTRLLAPPPLWPLRSSRRRRR